MANRAVILSYTRKQAPVIIDVVQYTTAPAIDFIIEDYTPTGEATIFIDKPSGEKVYSHCTINGNVITFVPTTQCFAEVGENPAQLQILDNEKMAVSFKMKFMVEENFIDDDAVESQSEFTELQEAIGTIGQYNTKIAELRQDLEDFETEINNDFTVFNSEAFTWRRVLTQEDDLNNITQMGYYAYNTGNAPQNTYYENGSLVEVMASPSDTTRIVQRVTKAGTGGGSAYRVLSSGNWSAWMATEVFFPLYNGRVTPSKEFHTIDTTELFAVQARIYNDLNVEGKVYTGESGYWALGDIVTGTAWEAVPVPSDNATFTTVGNIEIPRDGGRWLVFGIAQFATNGNGYRRVNLSTESGGAHTGLLALNTVVAASGVATDARAQWFYPGDGNRIYLNARQNSGSSLDTTGRLYAIKIQ